MGPAIQLWVVHLMILRLSFLIYQQRWPDSIISKIPVNSQMQCCICLDRHRQPGKTSLHGVNPNVSLYKGTRNQGGCAGKVSGAQLC